MAKPHYCEVTLDTYLDYKAFQKTLERSNQESLAKPLEDGQVSGTKNICFKVLPEVAERLDHTCAALGITKSLFLRLALDDAMGRAFERIDQITMDEQDWLEWVDQERAS